MDGGLVGLGVVGLGVVGLGVLGLGVVGLGVVGFGVEVSGGVKHKAKPCKECSLEKLIEYWRKLVDKIQSISTF